MEKEKKIYKCDICPAVFKTQRGLDNHKHRWICEICGAKLKTATGYERHMKNHKSGIVKEQKASEEAKQREEYFKEKVQQLKDNGLFVPKYKAGDRVILSTYIVTKPTHETWRHGRIVRVRYEEERRYFADTFTVTGYDEPKSLYLVEHSLKNNEPYPITYTAERGYIFGENQVFDTIAEAEADAKLKGDQYKEDCESAARCR